jgi:hypothetical protein
MRGYCIGALLGVVASGVSADTLVPVSQFQGRDMSVQRQRVKGGLEEVLKQQQAAWQGERVQVSPVANGVVISRRTAEGFDLRLLRQEGPWVVVLSNQWGLSANNAPARANQAALLQLSSKEGGHQHDLQIEASTLTVGETAELWESKLKAQQWQLEMRRCQAKGCALLFKNAVGAKTTITVSEQRGQVYSVRYAHAAQTSVGQP